MKNCLAILGFVFLVLLTAVGLLLALPLSGLLDSATPSILVNGQPLAQPEAEALASLGGDRVEWSNPLDSQPVPDIPPQPTPEPTLAPTATPLPPLDPAYYQSEVMIRLQNFAAPLEAFLDANERLGEDYDLFDDPAWRNEMVSALDQIAAAGQALAALDPPPPEYVAIDGWLKRVQPEAQALRDNYLLGMQDRQEQHFRASSDNFTRIRDYLYQLLEEAVRAGWQVD